ncbi:class I SAM-dependent methyltransferase [bacterium]|nr:class I SAM-dependent methyltransferase [bacterium]
MNLAALQQFLEEHIVLPSSHFKTVREYALNRDFPLISDQVGQQLQIFASFYENPKILELGSGFGYSAMWFSQGMIKGQLYLCDFSHQNIHMAHLYLDQIQKSDLIADTYVGNAVDYFGQNDEKFHIIFIDIDKMYYLEAIKRASDRLKPGGMIIMDNLFFGGRVYLDDGTKQRGRQSILDSIDYLKKDGRFYISMLDVGDGLLLAKLK